MLRRILLVARRDYIASVFTKAFLIGLVGLPLLFGGALFGVAIVRATQQNHERRIAILDHTGVAADAIIQAAKGGDQNSFYLQVSKQVVISRYQFEVVPPDAADPEGQRLDLADRIRREELFMLVEIGAGALRPGADPETSKVTLYASGSGIDDTRVWLLDAIHSGLRRVRLRQLGVGDEDIGQVLGGVAIERVGLPRRDPDSGEVLSAPPRNDLAGVAVPLVMLFLMMMIVMGTAAPMLNIIAEDKMQRVFEMLLVSITPFEIMMGKVLASLGRSLTSSVFYILGAMLGLQGAAMIGLVPFDVLPWFIVYMLAEVVMLSALGAALGAATSTSRDAQSLGVLLALPVMIPPFLILPLLQQPNGFLSTALSLFPVFTPMVMPFRQAMPGGVPAWQPWVGLAGSMLGAVVITWAAARIFRVTILMQGKPPRLNDLLRYALRG